MNNSTLTSSQEAELRDLLHRAASSVPVYTPSIESLNDRGQPRRRAAWLVPLAAAALVLVTVAGVIVASGGGPERRVAIAPGDAPPSAAAPEMTTGLVLKPGGGPVATPS